MLTAWNYEAGALFLYCMKTMNNLPAAILVDGDNASPERLEDIVRFVSKFGSPIIRRIYGDWNKPIMKKWREGAAIYSFRLIEAPVYVAGKNTTDIALVTDMMEFFYTEEIKIFCIVSSDSDFTLPVQRLREKGVTVLGWGESKTPISFRNSCSEFYFSDQEPPKEVPANTPAALLVRDAPIFEQAFELASSGKKEATLSALGTEIKKLMPKYKIKRYGCKTLGILYTRLEKYEIIKTGDKQIGNIIRLKTDGASLE